MIKNLTDWKTTFIGFILIGVSFIYLFIKDDIELTIFVMLLLIGIALLFAPDSLINGLKRFIKSNRDKKI